MVNVLSDYILQNHLTAYCICPHDGIAGYIFITGTLVKGHDPAYVSLTYPTTNFNL
jgi:hypothetical protein